MKPHLNLLNRLRVPAAALLATAAICTVRADYPSTVLGLNPLAYWRFNDVNTSPAMDTVTNDSPVGAAANGYVVMDVAQGQSGIVGNSVRLNNAGGTGHAGSKVDVPFIPAVNPNAPFSVEFWAKPASISTDANGLCAISGMTPYFFSANRSGWLFYLGNGGKWQLRLGGENSYVAIVGPVSSQFAAVGVWQHVAATFDGATAKLYVNGVLVGSSAAGAGFNPNQWMAIRVGGTSLAGDLGFDSGNRGWDGWIDEVAVYTNVLSQSALAAHYSAASTNNPGYHAQIVADGPIGYWGMDEAAFTTPPPSSLPTAANSGSVGTAAIGTNVVGALAAQNVLPYTGFGAGNLACFYNGESGYMNLPNPPALSNLVGQITLMAWIKPTARGGLRDIIAHGTDGNNIETYLRIGDTVDWEGTGDPNTAYYEIGTTADAVNYHSATYAMPPGDIGNWVFLAGTWDGANWNLYRNGQLVGTLADDTGPIAVTNVWSVGSRSLDDGNLGFGMFFSGWIDEPAIFGTALSGPTIQSLYYAANVPPTITQAPLAPSGPVYEGSTVSFSVWAEGNTTLRYQWTKNGAPLAGQTATNLTLSGVTVATSGAYAVVVTNSFGTVTSSVPLTVLTSLPIVTTQPAPATRFSGFPFTFSVGAIGSTPISYQWNLAGAPIGGATTSSYSGTAQNPVAGNYTCVLTNLYGSVTSSIAALTVLAHPAGYASTVLGDNPIAYWRLGESSGSVAHDYVGGNDGTYFNVALGQPGFTAIDPDTGAGVSGGLNQYVGNISGTGPLNFPGTTALFSLEAWVNGPAGQNDNAAIIAKGVGQNGGTANEQFCLDVSSGQWRFFTRGGANSLYSAVATTGPDGTWHHLVGVYDTVQNQTRIYVDGQLSATGPVRPAGVRASSAPVSLGSKRDGVDPNYNDTFNGTIDEIAVYNSALSDAQVAAHYAAAYGPSLPPTISHQPNSLTNFIGLRGLFSVSAFGTVPLSYQWKKGGVPLTDDGLHIFGSTSNLLAINPLGFADAGTYSVTVVNVNGTLNSASATLTVLAVPASPPAIPGLVLHLPFDGNLSDVTGRGNNGTAHGPISYVPDGVVGRGLHYYTAISTNSTGDGTYAVDTAAYVGLGVRPDLQFSSNINFSVAYWVRLPANYLGGDLPFFTDTTNSTFGAGFVFAPSYGAYGQPTPTTAWSGGWAYSLYDNNAANGVGVYGDVGSINDGNWHHLVHVFDRAANCVTYLDGLEAHFSRQAGTSAADAGNIDIDGGSPANIGQDASGQYVSGGNNDIAAAGAPELAAADIEDLGVWHKALTPLEAASIYVASASNHLSYVGAPVSLSIQRGPGSRLSVTWPAGILQSASTVAGPYTDVAGARSPYLVTPTSKQYYRIRQ